MNSLISLKFMMLIQCAFIIKFIFLESYITRCLRHDDVEMRQGNLLRNLLSSITSGTSSHWPRTSRKEYQYPGYSPSPNSYYVHSDAYSSVQGFRSTFASGPRRMRRRMSSGSFVDGRLWRRRCRLPSEYTVDGVQTWLWSSIGPKRYIRSLEQVYM